MDSNFTNRIEELALRAYTRTAFTFSDFLNPTETEYLRTMRLPVPVELFGGCDFAERKMARFGCGSDWGYVVDYPLAVMEIAPHSPKFAREVTHRDFLGAILNLGIDRAKLGDIFTDGKCGYAVVYEQLVPFIAQNLQKVGPNAVDCRLVDTVPEIFAPKLEERKISVSAPRIDAVICRLYGMSRDDGAKLVEDGRVFVNGRQCLSCAYNVKEGETVAVKGFGKFVFCEKCGTSAKGRTYLRINVFK